MPNTQLAYKYLNADGTPCNGGTGVWHMPKGSRPGKWMPRIKSIVPCQRGYHLCREQDLLDWQGPVLAMAEYRGQAIVHEDSKLVVEQARIVKVFDTWNERTQRLFACDCAEHVAHFYTPPKGTTWRPQDTIEVARRFANGQATREELAVAGDAAWDAARAAARAAGDAAGAAGDAAQDAAYAAAYAAQAAARAAQAAAYAAWAAEREWQLKRRLDYIEGRRG